MLWTSESYPTLRDVVHLYGEDYAGAMGDYPIWDEEKRGWIAERVYDHFELREIASDTPAAFLKFLRRSMHEIMPTLNPLFKALDEDVDILSSYHTFDNANDKSGTGVKAKQRTLFSATPQTQLSEHEDYATNLTDVGSTTDTNRWDANASEHFGRSRPVGEMTSSWLNGVNNALYILFDGLEPLFMQVWEITREGQI